MYGPNVLKLHGSKSRLLCKVFEHYVSHDAISGFTQTSYFL